MTQGSRALEQLRKYGRQRQLKQIQAFVGGLSKLDDLAMDKKAIQNLYARRKDVGRPR